MWESVRGRACERVRERSEKESASEGVRKQCREHKLYPSEEEIQEIITVVPESHIRRWIDIQ